MGSLLGVLAGCASSSRVDPRASAFSSDELRAGMDIDGTAVTSWPDASWWKAYQDPQLDALLSRAIAENPSMAAAASRVDVAKDLARVSGAALLPRIDGEASSQRARFTHNQFFPQELNGHDLWDPVWSNSASVNFSYGLDLWGRDRAALTASLDHVKVVAYEAQDVRLALESSVMRAYAELAYTYELQDNERAILEAENQTLTLSRKRLEAGLGTELEIQQANTAVTSTEAQLEQIANHLTLLDHQLAALTGKGPGEGDSIARPKMRIDQLIGLPSRVPAELIGRRPDVRAERWRVEQAAKTIDVAKTAFYPNIDLQAAVGFAGIGFSQFLNNRSLNAAAGPAITLPIFEGGRLRANLDSRVSEYDIAVSAYKGVIIDALRQVSDEISRLESLQRLRRRREENLAYASRAHDLAVVAFRSGLTDYINVLSTENELQHALSALAETSLQQTEARIGLNIALGGGLIADNEPTVVMSR
jgi:NodT family efflux transporter outer membrane factor (OMF) lipoprotein